MRCLEQRRTTPRADGRERPCPTDTTTGRMPPAVLAGSDVRSNAPAKKGSESQETENAVAAAAGGRATRAPGGAARADQVRVRAAPAEAWHPKSSSPPRLSQLFLPVAGGGGGGRVPAPHSGPVPSLPEGARRSSCAVRAATVPLVRPSTRCSDLPTPMVGTPLRTPREDGTEAAPRRVQSSPAGRGPWTS